MTVAEASVEGFPLARLPGRVRALVTDQFRDGGATIDTRRPAGPGVGARTVVQPDGDVLLLVDEEAWEEDAFREAHQRRVAEWFTAFRSTVTTARRVLRRGAALGGVIFASAGAVAAGAFADLVTSALVVLVGIPGGGFASRVLLRAGLRRLVDRAVYRPLTE